MDFISENWLDSKKIEEKIMFISNMLAGILHHN